MGSAEIQGILWGNAPSDWAEYQEPHHRPLWEAMLDNGNVGRWKRILDAGCGSGGASILAGQRGALVSGIDASAAMIEIARERVPNGDFRVGDIQALPFGDQTFDAVLAASSLQYSEDRVETLREMKRVTDRDGRVVVGLWSIPEKVEYRAVFEAVRNALPEPPPGKGPFELSSPGLLEDLILQAGMKTIAAGEASCPFDYPDFDTFWRANRSAGPIHAALQSICGEELERAVRAAVLPYQAADGSIHMENWFRYVVATHQESVQRPSAGP